MQEACLPAHARDSAAPGLVSGQPHSGGFSNPVKGVARPDPGLVQWAAQRQSGHAVTRESASGPENVVSTGYSARACPGNTHCMAVVADGCAWLGALQQHQGRN